MEAKVILFHSNESDKCKAFINNDVSLITSKNGKDDIWLGDGLSLIHISEPTRH